MRGDAIQRDARFGIFETHQALAEFFDEPLFAGRQMIGGDADAIADGFGDKVLEA